MGHILTNGENSVTVYGAIKPVFVGTDRNGTKLYHDNNCPRCCGQGSLEKWAFTGKVCFECGGTGLRRKPLLIKVYTPEFCTKLEERRAAREKRKAQEAPPTPSKQELEERADFARKNAWESEGFSRSGIGFAHFGDTYKNRNAIKRSGGRWNRFIKAYIAPVQVEGLCGVSIREIQAQELCNSYGYIDMDKALELAASL